MKRVIPTVSQVLTDKNNKITVPWYDYFRREQLYVDSSLGQSRNLIGDFNSNFSDATEWLNGASNRSLIIPPGTYDLSAGPYQFTQNGTSLMAPGGPWNTVFNANSTGDLLLFASTNPNTTSLFRPSVQGISIWNALADPTGGGAFLRFKSCDAARVDAVEFYNAWHGMEIEGSAGFFTRLTGQGYPFPTLETNSWLVRMGPQLNSSSSTAIQNTNVFFDQFILLAHGGTPFTLDNCIKVENCDNAHFENGIVGFAGGANFAVVPSSLAYSNIIDLWVNDCYIDGAGTTVPTAKGISISSSTSGAGVHHVRISNVKTGGCPYGIYSNYSGVNDIKVRGCSVVTIPSTGRAISITGANHVVVAENYTTASILLSSCQNVQQTDNLLGTESGAEGVNCCELTRTLTAISTGSVSTPLFKIVSEQAYNGAYIDIECAGIVQGVDGGIAKGRWLMQDSGGAVNFSTLENVQFPVSANFFSLTLASTANEATFSVSSNGAGGNSAAHARIKASGSHFRVDYP